MPSRPLRLTACGCKVPYGTPCPHEAARARQRKAEHDAKRPTASARGYGTKWREARAAFLRAHPTCTRCGAPATVVNHKIPHRGDQKLFWSRSNWEAVCSPCHNGPIQSEERS